MNNFQVIKNVTGCLKQSFLLLWIFYWRGCNNKIIVIFNIQSFLIFTKERKKDMLHSNPDPCCLYIILTSETFHSNPLKSWSVKSAYLRTLQFSPCFSIGKHIVYVCMYYYWNNIEYKMFNKLFPFVFLLWGNTSLFSSSVFILLIVYSTHQLSTTFQLVNSNNKTPFKNNPDQ